MQFQVNAPAISEAHVKHWEIDASSGAKNRVIEEILKYLSDRVAISPSAMFKYRLCMDEALTNSITHGSKDVASPVIHVDLFWSSNSWVVKILDQGPGFAPEAVGDLSQPGCQFQENGRGILIMDRYCASLVFSQGGREVTLRMETESVMA